MSIEYKTYSVEVKTLRERGGGWRSTAIARSPKYRALYARFDDVTYHTEIHAEFAAIMRAHKDIDDIVNKAEFAAATQQAGAYKS